MHKFGHFRFSLPAFQKKVQNKAKLKRVKKYEREKERISFFLLPPMYRCIFFPTPPLLPLYFIPHFSHPPYCHCSISHLLFYFIFCSFPSIPLTTLIKFSLIEFLLVIVCNEKVEIHCPTLKEIHLGSWNFLIRVGC